jgi:adenylate cyclase
MNLGAFDFVTKPIEFNDLELTIDKTLDDLEKTREVHRARIAAEQAKASLARYFSPNVAQRLAEDPESLDLSGERRELTFVFTDLADFTPLVETQEPSVIVPLLNEYLNGMTQIVFQCGGTVDKIVGDSVHAMFGAPIEQPDHTACGVDCAMELDLFAEAFRERKTEEGVVLGVTRIGVHAGPVIVGNFGGQLLFDYTAHGDAVNTAARLESVNKHLGTRICVSDKVVEQIPDFKGRPVGRIILRGKSQELKVFEPLTPERADAPAMLAYREAFTKLEAGDPVASQMFAAVVGQYGGDPLATFHLKRLLAGETGDLITFSG